MVFDKKMTVITMVRAAVTAAMYFILTFTVQPIAYGPLQFRIGEALTLLPILYPETVIGLTVGCLIANIFSPYMWYDMVFGTLATMIAALMTFLIGRYLRKKPLWARGLVGSLPPIFVNAVILPLIWLLAGTDKMYFINFSLILATQTGTIIILGIPLLLSLQKINKYIKS